MVEVAPSGRSASRAGSPARSGTPLQMHASFLHIARGLLTALRLSKVVDEKLSSKRVSHLAPGHRNACYVFSFCARVADLAPVYWVQSGCLTPQRNLAPSFVVSGAGSVGRCGNPLRCSTRPNNTLHLLFDSKLLQIPSRTQMDTPTPDKDLCNTKRT